MSRFSCKKTFSSESLGKLKFFKTSEGESSRGNVRAKEPRTFLECRKGFWQSLSEKGNVNERPVQIPDERRSMKREKGNKRGL